MKISGISLLVIFIVLAFVAVRMISPKSDAQIVESFEGEKHQPHIRYEDFKGKKVRLIEMQEGIDKSLPSLVFIHGSPGSTMDFKRYLVDDDLNARFNIMAYDRIGYSDQNPGVPLSSVDEEVELLHALLKDYDLSNTIVIGYSYGGTVAMASSLGYRKKVALAAAVKGELEPMFWALKLYEWKWTRFLLPKVVQAASQEKFRHVEELSGNDERWTASVSPVIAVHGREDFIVPYQNSVYLSRLLGDRLELVTLEEGNHALIWTDFDLIKKLLLSKLIEK